MALTRAVLLVRWDKRQLEWTKEQKGSGNQAERANVDDFSRCSN